jgi:cobalt-zinc-cadmium efflux system outer membrane protein
VCLAAIAPLFHPPALSAQAVPASTSPAVAALREAVQRTSPALAARRAAVDAAEARVRAAGAAAPATLSAEAEEIPGGVDLASASVRVGVEREFLGRGVRDGARAVAAAEVSAARADLAAAERRADALALRALTRAAAWSAISRRLGAEDSLLVSAEAALRARFSVGEARYVDVLRLRTERLRVQSEQAEALAEARAGRISLDALLAAESARDSLVARAVAEAGAGTPALAPALPVDSLLARAGAVQLAEARIERARASRILTLAGQRPRITAGLGIQRFPSGDGGSTLGPTLGGSVTLPFTARRSNQAATLAADREIAVAVAERDAAVAAVRAELAAARERYESARTRLAVFDAALLRGARDEREAALASFRSGELSLIELLDFERALARAETERLRSVLDACDALADLYAGGTESPDSPAGEASHDR